jgi:hypothetical protein
LVCRRELVAILQPSKQQEAIAFQGQLTLPVRNPAPPLPATLQMGSNRWRGASPLSGANHTERLESERPADHLIHSMLTASAVSTPRRGAGEREEVDGRVPLVGESGMQLRPSNREIPPREEVMSLPVAECKREDSADSSADIKDEPPTRTPDTMGVVSHGSRDGSLPSGSPNPGSRQPDENPVPPRLAGSAWADALGDVQDEAHSRLSRPDARLRTLNLQIVTSAGNRVALRLEADRDSLRFSTATTDPVTIQLLRSGLPGLKAQLQRISPEVTILPGDFPGVGMSGGGSRGASSEGTVRPAESQLPGFFSQDSNRRRERCLEAWDDWIAGTGAHQNGSAT